MNTALFGTRGQVNSSKLVCIEVTLAPRKSESNNRKLIFLLQHFDKGQPNFAILQSSYEKVKTSAWEGETIPVNNIKR